MKEVYLIIVFQFLILSKQYVECKVNHHHRHHHHQKKVNNASIGVIGFTDKRGFLDDVEDLWDSLFNSKKKEKVPVVPNILNDSGISKSSTTFFG